MFQGRIKYEPLMPDPEDESPDAAEEGAIIKKKKIDMIFDVSSGQRLTSALKAQLRSREDAPYIFSMAPPTLDTHSISFTDKGWVTYDVSGVADIPDKALAPAPAVVHTGTILDPRDTRANHWAFSMEMCRALGLDVTADSLPVKTPTIEESISGFTILKKWFDESNKGKVSSEFDPAKKIIVINIYAVTQSNLVSDDEWVAAVVELIKNVKDAYFLFTHGGPMDEDIAHVKRLVEMVKRELETYGTAEQAAMASQIILPRFESLYPYIHDIFGVTTAFVTVDTGLGHLANGVYDIPTAIVTSNNILHWLPTRQSTTAIIMPSLDDRNIAMLYSTSRGKQMDHIFEGVLNLRKNRIRGGVKEFALRINHDPERIPVRTVKLAAASIEDRAELDRNLLVEAGDQDCIQVKQDVRAYLSLRLNILGLSKVVQVPEIVFVDSSYQTELKTPRFATKLGISSKGVTYLMLDRSILKRDKDGAYFVSMEGHGMDIIHEVMGHLLARKLFNDFEEARRPTTMIRKIDVGKNRDRVVTTIRRTEEEALAKFMAILALHKLHEIDKSLVESEVVEAVSKLGADLARPNTNSYFTAALKWMKQDLNMSALRYRWLLTPRFEEGLLAQARTDHFPKILKVFGVAYEEAPWSNITHDMSDPAGLIKSLMDGVMDARLNKKKVMLVFDKNIAGMQSRMAYAVIEELNNLKKIPKYEKLLNNVTVMLADIHDMGSKIDEYMDQEDAAVFLFARLSQRNEIRDLEGAIAVHTAYVDDREFLFNDYSYYPICEIVALTLSQFVNGREEIDRIMPEIEKNLKLRMDQVGGTTVFMFLEPPKQFDTTEELMKRYGLLKNLLSNA